MFEVEIGSVIHDPVEQLLHHCPVFRVNPIEHELQCRLTSRIEFENSIGPLRPIDPATGNVPAEATDVTDSLCFGQVSFTFLKGFLRSNEVATFFRLS